MLEKGICAGSPYLFHWLSPVTTHQQCPKAPILLTCFIVLTDLISFFLTVLIISLTLVDLLLFPFFICFYCLCVSFSFCTPTKSFSPVFLLTQPLVMVLYRCSVYSFSPRSAIIKCLDLSLKC